MEQPELSETELLGLRTRVVWRYITSEEPGSWAGNPVVPFVLLTLARYFEANVFFLEHLSQTYGSDIQETADRLVQEGLVERIIDDEGEFYRLTFFPKGYEKHITAIADPIEYIRHVTGNR